MKTAIFLGAGAASAEGVPLQKDLLSQYFAGKNQSTNEPSSHEVSLKNFFNFMFDIDVNSNDIREINFPTFEEVLGVLDLASINNESFRWLASTRLGGAIDTIDNLRLYLIYLMSDVIDSNIKTESIHKKLINKLFERGDLDNTIFITTNYDVLCDNAIRSLYPQKKLDYCVDFVNFRDDAFERDDTFERPDELSVKLFKLHGSLNWLHCPTCNNLRITKFEESFFTVLTSSKYCTECETVYSPIIVPPTFYKDLSKVFLRQVWNKAESELIKTDHLMFCGYSFPDADMHIKYLIKRIQKNRKHKCPLKISVINNHEGKTSCAKKEERSRYQRFLGIDVNYTEYSFNDFAEHPEIVMSS